MSSKTGGNKRKPEMKKTTVTPKIRKTLSSISSQPSASTLPTTQSTDSSRLHSEQGSHTVVDTTPLESPDSEGEEVKVLSDDEYLTLLASRSRADVWDHYTRKCVDGRVKAVCKWCKTKEYFADSGTNGTRNLRSHIETCMKYPPNQEKRAAKGQTLLGYIKKKEEGKLDELHVIGFSQAAITKACVQMVVLDELPFSFVEGEGFRRFCLRACPEWRVPCRQTIAREVLTMYYHEKEQLKSELSSYRVALTTDTWTSIQNLNYMVVTAHYIDYKWVLHKKVLNFCLIPNHKGESIGRLLEECVAEWGLKKISTITVDNASANDAGLRDFTKRISDWDDANVLLQEGENLHMRCVAHIINRIVNDGLKSMQGCIQSIRSAVRYVRSSPQRLATFNKCVEKAKIESKGSVVLDVSTRWNSTYLMLLSAMKFKKAFDRLILDDDHYSSYFSSESTTKMPPQDGDWKIAELCANFLKPFYDVTLRVCCSKNPTIHQTFEDLFKIKAHMKLDAPQPEGSLLTNIIGPMQVKYNKYWGKLEKVNPYLFIAMILDPRYKFYRLHDILEVISEEKSDDDQEVVKNRDLIPEMTFRVKDLLMELYNNYAKDVQAQPFRDAYGSGGGSEISNDSSIIAPTSIEKVLQEKIKKRKQKEAEVIHNEVDRYFNEAIEGDEDQDFDILNWWRVNGSSKYPILRRVAQDVLAIPVSTIASESTFSTSGRTISPYRSCLRPKMVEALICTQNWLRETYVALDLEPTSEELEFCEAIEKEIGDKGQGEMLPPKP